MTSPSVSSLSPAIEVEGPPFEPYRYGLLSAVDVLDGSGRWELGGVVYATVGCEESGGEWDTLCPTDPPPPPPPPTKNLTVGVDNVEGKPFILYDSVACHPHSGRTEQEIADLARLRHDVGEQRKLERRFWAWLRANATVVNPEPVTAVSMCDGLGELEQRVAAENGGIGVFHAARPLITGARRHDFARHREGFPDRLVSAGDNVWVFGAGYDRFGPGEDGTEAPAGQAWIYATGPLVLRRSEMFTNSVFDQRRNERRTVAERSYVLTAECPVLAVLVTIPEC